MIDGLLFVAAITNFCIMVAAAQNPMHPVAVKIRDCCAGVGVVILAVVTYRMVL